MEQFTLSTPMLQSATRGKCSVHVLVWGFIRKSVRLFRFRFWDNRPHTYICKMPPSLGSSHPVDRATVTRHFCDVLIIGAYLCLISPAGEENRSQRSLPWFLLVITASFLISPKLQQEFPKLFMLYNMYDDCPLLPPCSSSVPPGLALTVLGSRSRGRWLQEKG